MEVVVLRGVTWSVCEGSAVLRHHRPSSPGPLRRNCPTNSSDRLEKKASSLVTWYGELCFELHRGVYTTQAKEKLNNRKSEFLLRDIELLAYYHLQCTAKLSIPQEGVGRDVEGVMLCQFHDCLPGSAIKMCYDDFGSGMSEISCDEPLNENTDCDRYITKFSKPVMIYFSASTRC